MTTTDTTYNGWKNYQTWNVILWIMNDEGLNSMAREAGSLARFRESLADFDGALAYQTPDGVAWNDSALDVDAIDAAIRED